MFFNSLFKIVTLMSLMFSFTVFADINIRTWGPLETGCKTVPNPLSTDELVCPTVSLDVISRLSKITGTITMAIFNSDKNEVLLVLKTNIVIEQSTITQLVLGFTRDDYAVGTSLASAIGKVLTFRPAKQGFSRFYVTGSAF
jgi:hypothetical protein